MHDKVRDSLDGSANGAAKHPRWNSRGRDARLGHTVDAGGAEHGRSGRNGGPEKRVLRQGPSYIAGWDTAGSRIRTAGSGTCPPPMPRTAPPARWGSRPTCGTGRKRGYSNPMEGKKRKDAKPLDPVRRRLLRLLKAKGSTMITASLAMGRNAAYPGPRSSRRGDPNLRAGHGDGALYAKNWKGKGNSSEKSWRQTLRDYAFPRLGRKRVHEIKTGDVLACLVPIWNEKRVTASRVRHRIGAVMKWAVAKGYREDNPAGDAIAAALPRNNGRQKHHRALPHAEVAAALEEIRGSDAWQGVRLCLEFVVLTAARSGEARLARWDEIDLEAATWTVPEERMKAGREHRVPLSDRALAVLRQAQEIADSSGLVFPSLRGLALQSAPLSKLVRELGIKSTVHGFRSSFRDWAAETGVERAVAEAALAHTVGGVEGAYLRSDLFARRREVMQAWSDYLRR